MEVRYSLWVYLACKSGVLIWEANERWVEPRTEVVTKGVGVMLEGALLPEVDLVQNQNDDQTLNSALAQQKNACTAG